MTMQERSRRLRSIVLALVVLLSLATIPSAVHQSHAENRVPAQTLRFKLDPSQSKFIAHAERAGLLWFKGHDHYLAARRFSGTAEFTPGSIVPASLELHVDANSLEETGDSFTPQQKEIINKEVREIVLEPEKYPEIVFKSTDVTGKAVGNNQYELKIGGNLTLHGITRRLVIPAKITLANNTMRAVGDVSFGRSNFNVKATSAFHGLVRVSSSVEIEFDIVAQAM